MIIAEVCVPPVEKYLEMCWLVALSLHLHLCPRHTSIKASGTVPTTPSQDGYWLEKIITNALFKKRFCLRRELSLEGRWQKRILLEVCKIRSGGRWIWSYCLLLFLRLRWRHPGKRRRSEFTGNKSIRHDGLWHGLENTQIQTRISQTPGAQVSRVLVNTEAQVQPLL